MVKRDQKGSSGDILEVKGGLVGNRVRGLVFGWVNNCGQVKDWVIG